MADPPELKTKPMKATRSTSLFLLACAFTLGPARADTWDSGGANNNWGTAGNWDTNIVPLNNGTAAIVFGSGARTSPVVDVAWSIQSLTYNVGAPAMALSGAQLTIGTGGILHTNNTSDSISDNLVMNGAQSWNSGLGNLTVTGSVANNGNLLTVDGIGTLTLNGSISGSGGITKVSTGTLTLGGTIANSFSGTTTVNAGTLTLGKTGVSDSTITGNLIIGDGSGSDVVRLDQNYQIKDTVGVTVNSSGTLNINGHIDDFMTLTLAGGSVTTGALGSLGLFGDVTGLASNTEATISGNLNLTGAIRTFNLASGPAAIDLGISAGIFNGGIVKNGVGYLELSGANTFAGGLTLNAGRMYLTNDAAAGTGTLTLNGGYLAASGTPRNLSNAVVLGGNVELDGSGFTFNGATSITADRSVFLTTTAEFTGALTQSGGPYYLIKNGTGQLTLSGSSANTASVQVNTGTLVLNKSAGVDAVAGNLGIGDAVGGANADVVRLNNSYQINGSVSISSSGLLDTNGYAETIGNLNMTGGNITTGTGSLGVFGDLTSTADPMTATISGNYVVADFVTVFHVADGPAAIDLDIQANVSGSQIIKDGAGTVRLAGNNSFSGGFWLEAGALALGSNGALGSGVLAVQGASILADGATRTLGNAVTFSGDSSIAGSQTLYLNGAVTMLSGSLAINTALAKFDNVTVAGGSNTTLYGPGTLQLGGVNTVNGGITLASGTLSANSIRVTNTGTFTQNGGTFAAGDLNIEGAFVYNGGTFNGKLINQGNATFNADFAAGSGITNFSSLTITSGRTVAAGGAGMDNEGAVVLAGGTLAATAPIVNNGLISGSGAIAITGGTAVGFTNNAQLTLTGNLTLSNAAVSGINANAGNIDVPAGVQLRLNASTLANGGSINLAAGSVAGSGTLDNQAGGILIGRGLIASAFANTNGTLQPQGGTINVTNPFTNAGLIRLVSGSGLAGGAITNTGRIQGDGSLANPVTNTGRIEPLGTLAMSGTVTNTGTGLITAASGNSVVFTSGLATNAAVINLTGGSFDNNGHPLTNTGQITGFGSLSTGGLSNAVGGKITLTGGTSTVNGDVTNNGSLRVLYNPVTFTGNFTNNGTVKITTTTVTYGTGTYTNNGIYNSDPATNTFAMLVIGASGALQGGPGDVFVVGQDLVNGSERPLLWDTGAARIAFAGAGDHALTWPAADLGANAAGYLNNCAVGEFALGSGGAMTMIDGGAPGGALYVGALELADGLGQLAAIKGNGMNVYYDASLAANAYLAGQSYSLSGGGLLEPVFGLVPEAGSAGLLGASLGLLVLRRRRSGAGLA